MKKKEALTLRRCFNTLFGLTEEDRYQTAIRKRGYRKGEEDFEVHLFLCRGKSLGFIGLALLSQALERMYMQFCVIESTYDRGTKEGEDITNSIKIY